MILTSVVISLPERVDVDLWKKRDANKHTVSSFPLLHKRLAFTESCEHCSITDLS